MSRKFSAVAFDLDGTLYPNYRLNFRLLPFLCKNGLLLAALAKARNIIRSEQKQSPTSVLPDFYGYQAQITAKLLHAQAGHIKQKVDDLIYRGWEAHFLKISLFPHVQTVLAELRAAGLKLGLLSDFPPLAKLKNLGLAGYWDTVLCSEDIGALKPAMQPFIDLTHSLGFPPEQILYVGNSRPYDVAGAGRAGMKTALLTGRLGALNKSKADFIFHDYRQLRDFVL